MYKVVSEQLVLIIKMVELVEICSCKDQGQRALD